MYHDYAAGVLLTLAALYTLGTMQLDRQAQQARDWANRWKHLKGQS